MIGDSISFIEDLLFNRIKIWSSIKFKLPSKLGRQDNYGLTTKPNDDALDQMDVLLRPGKTLHVDFLCLVVVTKHKFMLRNMKVETSEIWKIGSPKAKASPDISLSSTFTVFGCRRRIESLHDKTS